MSLIVTPCWTRPDGTETAHYHFRAAQSQAEAARLVERGIADAVRGGGTNIVVMVLDDIAGRIVYRIRPRAAGLQAFAEVASA